VGAGPSKLKSLREHQSLGAEAEDVVPSLVVGTDHTESIGQPVTAAEL